MKVFERNDFAVAIGWPETYCKQPGVWFDTLGKWLNVNKNGYYKIGHSALLLIDTKSKKCHYYDFGRYHAPFKKGRVRSHRTDPLLEVRTAPIFNDELTKILNIKEILKEMQLNAEYHTEGKLIASYTGICLSEALVKAQAMQEREILEYGLLKFSKMNCGRFVSQVIRAGKPHWFRKFRLQYCTLIVPSTKSNYLALGNKIEIPHLREVERFYPHQVMSKKEAISVLAKPAKAMSISVDAQWLGGEGMGCWFDINIVEDNFLIRRWTDLGDLESAFDYKMESGNFDLNNPFQISYPSNSMVVTVVQNQKSVRFTRIEV